MNQDTAVIVNLTEQSWILRLHDEREGIPYGVALATGAAARGAGGAVVRSMAQAASRPFTTAARSIKESFAAGQVRAWRASDSPAPANSSSPRARASPIRPESVAQAVHTARSSIPPENSGGPGMQAPIRPES